MPEYTGPQLPPGAARTLTTLRLALLSAGLISLGWAIFCGTTPYSLLWCLTLWLVLAVIWQQFFALCRRALSGELQDESALPARQDAAFLASMGHDLRQPAQAAALFAATLATHALPESSRKLVEGIETAIHQLSEQMETVFSIAKIYAGRVGCAPSRIELKSTLEMIVAAQLEDAHEIGIHLRHVNTNKFAMADEDIVFQTVGLLIKHAFSVKNTSGVVVGCRQRGQSTVLEVWCNGDGIEPEQASGVFTSGSTYGQRFPDHGMGLVLAKCLADLMGSPLQARSARRKGCVFELTLAVAGPAPK
jgi:K+-sensing histidine kinase KdpD